ncbi:MAG TPA: VCBS repeat-containing protein, partial [Gemmatimonadaceae bacterium]|nr:VCBS repeat-containing protein [Gemmatimonadaceae bacterium]
MTQPPPHRPRSGVRRAIMAVPFLGAILLAMRLDRGPTRATTDASHPGFALRDETAAAGIHFVHHRPSFDPKIAGVEPHVAALGASVSVTDFDGDGKPDLYFTNSRFGEPNALYRNRGDGTFEDVAASAGLTDLNRAGEGV